MKAELYKVASFYNGEFPDKMFLDNGDPIEIYYRIHDRHTPNNTYYCWREDSSKVHILETTEKLSQNMISQKKLVEISPDDDKLSILYYISVAQNRIRKEAYIYYSNLMKNIEQTGSLFSPIPSERKGNITCVTDPKQTVVGYIEVSTTTMLNRFINEAEGLYEPPVNECGKSVYPLIPEQWDGLDIYEFTQSQGHGPEPDMALGVIISHAPRSCLDCRYKKGTKNKPAFWPNNHQ